MVVLEREFNYLLASLLFILHIVALIGVVYWYYTGFYAINWTLAAIRTIGIGIGVSIWYHRCLTHRSFSCNNKVIAYTLTCLGGLLQDAQSWVSNHLSHHAHTDTALDPHSPYWPYKGWFRGFWWSHIGWLCWHFKAPARYQQHLLQDSVILWEHKWHVYIVISGFIVPSFLGGIYGSFAEGWIGFAVHGIDSLLLTAVTTVCILYIICSINSLGHMMGWRARKKDDKLYAKDSSRNNPWLALISFGEGNHGDHHKHPGSARIGWLDPSWPVILFFEKLGVFTNVHRPFQLL